MTAPSRPRRSALYMPGSNSRALDKARSLDVDCVIMDLEDAVAPQSKLAARDAACAAVRRGGYGHRELVIRINALETPWGPDDLKAVAGSGAHAVLLPKIDTARQVQRAAAALRDHGAPDGLALWLMAETPAGIEHIGAIAAADPAVEVIVMGTSDLAKALRLPSDPARRGLQMALSRCVLAARAQGLDILDGVFGELANDPAFRESCEQGKALGFDGKTLVHPRQIAIANDVFGVAESELELARRILAAWEQAAAAGRGIAVVDGQMVEELHAEEARRRLDLAAAIANR